MNLNSYFQLATWYIEYKIFLLHYCTVKQSLMKMELRVWKKCFQIFCNLTQSGSLSERVDLIVHRAAGIADMHYTASLNVSAFQGCWAVHLHCCSPWAPIRAVSSLFQASSPVKLQVLEEEGTEENNFLCLYSIYHTRTPILTEVFGYCYSINNFQMRNKSSKHCLRALQEAV